MTDRKAFEDEAKKHGGFILDRHDGSGMYAQTITRLAWTMWQAATAAEREWCAEVCESLRDTISDPLVIGEVAHHAGHNALQSAADAIRKGE